MAYIFGFDMRNIATDYFVLSAFFRTKVAPMPKPTRIPAISVKNVTNFLVGIQKETNRYHSQGLIIFRVSPVVHHYHYSFLIVRNQD